LFASLVHPQQVTRWHANHAPAWDLISIALGLELVQHYNSEESRPDGDHGILGRGWRLSYDTEISTPHQQTTNGFGETEPER
jgi:hypothetical protein